MFGQMARQDYAQLTNEIATSDVTPRSDAFSPGTTGQTPIFSFPASGWPVGGSPGGKGPQSSSMASSTAFSNAGSYERSFLEEEDRFSDGLNASLLSAHRRNYPTM